MTFHDYLIAKNACPAALDWLGDRTPYEAWRRCERADWMMWLAGHIAVDQRRLVLCATTCARAVLHLVPIGEDRPRLAIEAAEAWAHGRGTAEAAWYAAKGAAWAADAAAGAVKAAERAAARAAEWAACVAAARPAEWAEDIPATGATWWTAASVSEAATAAEVAQITMRAAAMRRYARGVRSVIPWAHVADRLRAAGVEVDEA
jgi:hypothetical protein